MIFGVCDAGKSHSGYTYWRETLDTISQKHQLKLLLLWTNHRLPFQGYRAHSSACRYLGSVLLCKCLALKGRKKMNFLLLVVGNLLKLSDFSFPLFIRTTVSFLTVGSFSKITWCAGSSSSLRTDCIVHTRFTVYLVLWSVHSPGAGLWNWKISWSLKCFQDFRWIDCISLAQYFGC